MIRRVTIQQQAFPGGNPGDLGVEIDDLIFTLGGRNQIVASAKITVTGTAITQADTDNCGVVRTDVGIYQLTLSRPPDADAQVYAFAHGAPLFAFQNGPFVNNSAEIDIEDAAAAATDASFLAIVVEREAK